MRKLAVEGDNCVLERLTVASQHGSRCTEPWDGIRHVVEVIVAVFKQRGFCVDSVNQKLDSKNET